MFFPTPLVQVWGLVLAESWAALNRLCPTLTAGPGSHGQLWGWGQRRTQRKTQVLFPSEGEIDAAFFCSCHGNHWPVPLWTVQTLPCAPVFHSTIFLGLADTLFGGGKRPASFPRAPSPPHLPPRHPTGGAHASPCLGSQGSSWSQDHVWHRAIAAAIATGRLGTRAESQVSVCMAVCHLDCFRPSMSPTYLARKLLAAQS